MDQSKNNKKKGYLIFGAIVALIVLVSAVSGSSTPTDQNTAFVYKAVSSQTAPTAPVKNTPNLSNNNSYVNVSGNTVHSPAYSLDKSVPAGASARCKDGTYSFSQNRRGTCSHHGGVSIWLQ